MSDQSKQLPLPPWIRVRLPQNPTVDHLRTRLRELGLHTVCESAFCPNIGRCWASGRATILILGNNCTRHCRFCHVDKEKISPPDPAEPRNVAQMVAESGLKEVVLTSVTRDDLPDGGAAHWAKTVQEIRRIVPQVKIEVLIPDFLGDQQAIQLVIDAQPDIMGHNIETVRRLYPRVRPEANYERSLQVLRQVATAGIVAKTSMMLGLGEKQEEVEETLIQVYEAGCSIVYLGQYLRPSPRHLPVAEYVTPEQFTAYGDFARKIGFRFVASAPLVRSSYYEEGQWKI